MTIANSADGLGQKDELHLLLIEPTGTPNTGDVKTAAPRKTA